jgi:dephospho-CoA kinase
MIIGIIGTIGSGKSTLASYISQKYGYTEYSFADPLKKIGELFGFTRNQLYGTQAEKLEINDAWGVSGREFLQKVGTELFRDQLNTVLPGIKLHKGVWCDIFRYKYTKQPGNYVIPDVRFPDEVETIKGLGGILIRIERDINEKHTHRSETSLNNIIPDFTIKNNGDIKELYNKFEDVYKSFKTL